VSEEEDQRARHRPDQDGSQVTAAPAAPRPETPGLYASQHDDLPDRLWAFDDLDEVTDAPAADVTGGLVSLGFIGAALRRGKRLWVTTAVVGLVIGLGLVVKSPPAFPASTTVLLANNPAQYSPFAALDDQAIIQSRAVADAALRRLGLPESGATNFMANYTATVITGRVLLITVKAKAADLALREANALATAFLTFQATQAKTQTSLVNAALQQEIVRAQQHIDSISRQIKQVRTQPASSSQRAQLASLSAKRTGKVTALAALKTANSTNQTTTRINDLINSKGSRVLDPATLLPKHSKAHLALYVGGGLIGGLMLGMIIVILRALTSDRLRRRDDVARTLGAPVKLSVGRIKLGRRWSRSSGLAAAESPEIRRIVQYLGRAVTPRSGGVATLAVVPVDDPQVAALSLASLAVSCSHEGLRVIVADLCPDNPAARLLGADEPGVHTVSVHDAHLIVTVPDRDDVAPAGPLSDVRRPGKPDPSAGPLVAACASANLLLTLVSLDPSTGADHLNGWADGAVAVVTAGQATAVRIQAVGELIRLSGVKLISAVLVDADRDDESLGEPDPSVAVGSDPG
jgi:capsular polysaccharide biosynthesis protein